MFRRRAPQAPTTRERLTAAGFTGVTLDDLAQQLDREDAELRNLLLDMADARARGTALWQCLTAQESAAALRLHARGVDPATLAELAAHDSLWRCEEALEAGCPLETLRRAAPTDRLSAATLTALYTAHAPDGVIEELLRRTDVYPSDVLALHALGCTWPQIHALLGRPIELRGIDLFLETLTDGGGHLPLPVRLLASVLYSVVTDFSHTEDGLPVAAAIAGQPWEGTAWTLLTDQPAVTADTAAGLILAARALDHDPTLPDTGGQPHEALDAWVSARAGQFRLSPGAHPAASLRVFAAAAIGQEWVDDVTVGQVTGRTGAASYALAAAVVAARPAPARLVAVAPPGSAPDAPGW